MSDENEHRLPPTYRQIEPELYREHYKFGIRIKDLPIVAVGGLVIFIVPLYLRLGPLMAAALLFTWIGASTGFLRWARNKRRPLWLEHKLEGAARGKIQHRVSPGNEKYGQNYLLDD